MSDQTDHSAKGWRPHGVVIGLNAVVVSVQDETPHVLVVDRSRTPTVDDADTIYGLPFGPFDPETHRTLEIGLRTWVGEQTSLDLGYVEQLYTFGDRGRDAFGASDEAHIISVGYLALTEQASKLHNPDSVWHKWYRYFPWEDWREQSPNIIAEAIQPALRQWADDAPDPGQKTQRWERACMCFGFDQGEWDAEKVLERYELLYEARLVAEFARDRNQPVTTDPPLGEAMTSDHRRILATAMGRLRSKLKYRPVVFELMPSTFTLLHLQQTVEAILGIRLHKQNFRRLVEKEGLVEGTGKISTRTGGRPAEEFRFRSEVLTERPAPGVRVRTIAR